MNALPREIETLIRDARRSRRRAEATAAALRGGGWWLAAVLAAVAIDALLGLPAWGLVAVDVLLLTLLAVAAAWVVRLAMRRPSDAAVARDLESASGLDRSQLINALHLSRVDESENGGGRQPGSAALRRAAVDRGTRAAASVPARALVDRAAVRRAARVAGVAAGVAMLGLLLPGVYQAVMPRLLAPTADYPPFTLLRFDAAVEPEPVLYGQAATIRAEIDSPARLPEKVELVLDATDAHPRQAVRMLHVAPAPGAGGDRSRGTFTVRFARAEVDRTFYIDTPRGRSRRYLLDVRPVPRVEYAAVAYDYPDYTGWDDAETPLTDEGLRGLVGTTATLEIRATLPLAGGTLRFTPDPIETGDESTPSTGEGQPQRTAGEPRQPRELPLTVADGDPARAAIALPIEQTGAFRVDLVGRDGTPSSEPLVGRVTAVPDDPPRITVREPAARVVAPADASVRAEFLAVDDVGLDGVTLRRSINGRGPSATPLGLEPTDLTGRRATARGVFDLAALGVAEGDVITYAARVRDNHPDAPRTAETDLMSIEVVSTERYLELMRTRYRAADIRAEWERYRRRLDALAAERDAALEALDALMARAAAGEALTEAERQRVRALREALEGYRNAALDLAERLNRRVERPTLYAFENPYKDMLRRVSQELQAQAQYAGELQRAATPFLPGQAPPSASARRGLTDAAQRFAEQAAPFTREQRREWDQAEQDLEAMQMADAMWAAGERIRQVVEEQRELADRLAAYRLREKLSPAEALRARRLAERQEDLRVELEAALADLRAAAGDARERLPTMSGGAVALCDRAAEMRVTRDMTEAARFAQAGVGRDAYDAADTAARKLDTLLSDPAAGRMQSRGDLDGCFDLPRATLEQALDQMAQARGIPGLGSGEGGGSGYGLYGSLARMGVVGPNQHGSGDSDADSGARGGGRGDGRVAGQGTARPPAAGESVVPDHVRTRSDELTLIPGVLPEYREEAEAYFRRLADDASP